MDELTAIENLLMYLDVSGRPISPSDGARVSGVADPKSFSSIVRKLEDQGKIVVTKQGNLFSAKKAGIFVCRLVSYCEHFAFARPDDGSDDIFIDAARLNGALAGDSILVGNIRQKQKGPSGEVLRILEAGEHMVTGKIQRSAQHRGFELKADVSYRFPIPIRPHKGQELREGDKVFAELSLWRDNLQADIIKVYGEAASARVCADSILDGHNIPTVFPPQVLQEAKEIGSRGLAAEDVKNRLDLRDQPIFTIDSASAKDLDDAISVRKTDSGWELGVHIADVSHYVRSGSAVDLEARRRGTSVYFADRVVPMLPEVISNGVCSLNAGTDKLAFSALMKIASDGQLTEYRFVKTVIDSKVRGVYDEVNEIYAGTADSMLLKKYAPVMDGLTAARELAAVLRARAASNGTMELETREPCFVLNDEGVCVDMYARKSGEAEQMIEQMMITANQAAAKLAQKAKLPFVYRVHGEPSPDRLESLRELTGLLGLDGHALLPGVTPKDLSAVLERAKKTKYARIISHQMLRTMAKARYDTKPLGHYGLALKDYCHFTSPIRRYPDTSIHRILSGLCSGMSSDELRRRYEAFAAESATQSSQCEIRAMAAERAAEDCYSAEYLGQHIGEEFFGNISGITEWGIYVELECSAEGFIRADSLPSGFLFDGNLTFTRRSSGTSLTIGDPMQVRVIRTDVSSGQVDFLPVNCK